MSLRFDLTDNARILIEKRKLDDDTIKTMCRDLTDEFRSMNKDPKISDQLDDYIDLAPVTYDGYHLVLQTKNGENYSPKQNSRFGLGFDPGDIMIDFIYPKNDKSFDTDDHFNRIACASLRALKRKMDDPDFLSGSPKADIMKDLKNTVYLKSKEFEKDIAAKIKEHQPKIERPTGKLKHPYTGRLKHPYTDKLNNSLAETTAPDELQESQMGD